MIPKNKCLQDCSALLVEKFPGISLDLAIDGEIHGKVPELGCNLRISNRGRFGFLVCESSHDDATARELVEFSSKLPSPLRFSRRSDGTVELLASWPMAFEDFGIFRTVVEDLRMVLGVGGKSSWPQYELSANLWRQLKLVIVAEETKFVEVPASEGAVEFRIREGSKTRQWRCSQPNKHVFSISSLVTNWHADSAGTARATSELILRLNRRLRWVKLVKRNSTICAEVSFPVRSKLPERFWSFGKSAITQSIVQARDQLRMIQTPEVACVFESLYLKKNCISV